MIDKPPHGQPCNSCGYCCRMSRCPLAQLLFDLPEMGVCPALQEDGDRGVCGLVVSPMAHAMVPTLRHGPDKMRAAALELIGSGVGCDALRDGEQPDRAYESQIRHRKNSARRSVITAALRTWGVLAKAEIRWRP